MTRIQDRGEKTEESKSARVVHRQVDREKVRQVCTFKEIPSFGSRSLRTTSQSLRSLSFETVLSVRAMVRTVFLKSTNSWTTRAVISECASLCKKEKHFECSRETRWFEELQGGRPGRSRVQECLTQRSKGQKLTRERMNPKGWAQIACTSVIQSPEARSAPRVCQSR